MSIEKKILKNRPYEKANGQYNFTGSLNLGIEQTGNITDIQSDLYTINESNLENEEQIEYPGTSIAGGGKLVIDYLWAYIRQDSDAFDMRFYLIDGDRYPEFRNTIKVTTGTDSDPNTLLSNGTSCSPNCPPGLTYYNYNGYTDLFKLVQFSYNGYYEFIANTFIRNDEWDSNSPGSENIIGRMMTDSSVDFDYTGDGSSDRFEIAWNQGSGATNIGAEQHGMFRPDIDFHYSGLRTARNTFFTFENFPYVDESYFDIYEFYEDRILMKAWGGSDASSNHVDALAKYEKWFNPQDSSDISTRINLDSWYDVANNYTDPRSAFYFMVWWNSSKAAGKEGRKETVSIYRLPKYIFYKAWQDGNTKTIKFRSDLEIDGMLTSGDMEQPVTNTGFGGWDPYDDDPVFGGSGGGNNEYIFPFPVTFSDEEDELSPAGFFGNADFVITPPSSEQFFDDDNKSVLESFGIVDKDTLIGMNPYSNTTYTANDIVETPFDFRAISHVSSSWKNNPYELQNYYENKEDRTKTSAPNEVVLEFLIAENFSSFDIDYIYPNNWENLKFKGFVINWDWKEGDPDEWSEIRDDFPQSEPELNLKRTTYNTYNFIDIYDFEREESNKLKHYYQTSGVKIIKAIVCSYYEYPDLEYIQIFRWKLVTIKINLNVDNVYVQDFSDLGGNDYRFIPWPQTTPVVGGISDESKYITTLNGVVKENQFREDEVVDKLLALDAIENDELGNYLGKSDIAQMRYFTTGSFDMNKLLMIDNLIVDEENNFNPYYNFNYWNGNTITGSYSKETCVGTIFINDNMNVELSNSTLIELNLDEIDERTIRDSSGNGFKGLLLGDYAIRKDGKDTKIRRQTDIKIPEIDNDKKAF